MNPPTAVILAGGPKPNYKPRGIPVFEFPDWLKVHGCIELGLVKQQVNRLLGRIDSRSHRAEALKSWLEQQVANDREWCERKIPEVLACKLEIIDLDSLESLDSGTKLFWPVVDALEILDRLALAWKGLRFSQMKYGQKNLEVIRVILKVDYFVIMIKFLELNLLKNHIDRFLKNVIWYNLSIKLLLILVQPR